MVSTLSSMVLRISTSVGAPRLLAATSTTAPATGTFIHRFYASQSLRPRGPGPIPLGSSKDQAEFEQLIKKAESDSATTHPDARSPVPDEFEGDTNPSTGEVGGPKREPVRFGDWSFKGRVTDF
ncbi:putative mitochondrial protein, conserved [Dissophora globulifera]|uniref:Succinate dehydrogenase assembly factor 4, mitochondrial n=1 Tax=Dissophora globulifera TaxID=979702 RepID=A0A9P6RVH0_9FUNG|nr:putative mitochondrial protein, conserved [Dissophora globulifera]